MCRDAAVVVTGYDHQKKKTKIGLTAEVAQSKNRISPAAEKMTVDEKASTERVSVYCTGFVDIFQYDIPVDRNWQDLDMLKLSLGCQLAVLVENH
jgi:hypothetical protein